MVNCLFATKRYVPLGQEKDMIWDALNLSQRCPNFVPLSLKSYINNGFASSQYEGTFLMRLSREHSGTHLSLFIERVSRVVPINFQLFNFVTRCNNHA